MPITKNKVLLVIPVYNEARYVRAIIEAVCCYCKDILVVNDGSDDETAAILREYDFLKILDHCENQGYGQSLIDAFFYANANGYDWAITMDCDYQHQPCGIPLFYDEIKKDDADIISGSRYLNPENNIGKAPPERVYINNQITGLLNQMLGLALTDAFCGFKAYRVKATTKLKLTEQGYALPLQLWIQAASKGLKVREIAVPLIYHDPKRNFAGLLEVPEFRMQYYMEIIQRELALYGYTNSAEITCP